MTTFTSVELDGIGKAEELEIMSLLSDGTLRKPTTVWVVRLGDDLYIRSVYGRASAWFRGTQVRHEGRIRAGGIEKDVPFSRQIPVSTIGSTPGIGLNTAATLQASSTRKSPPMRERRHSS